MKWMIMVLAALLAMPAWAQDVPTELAQIQQRWAEIQYQTPEQEKEKAFEALATEAKAFVERYPGRAEPLIWQGIVLSTYAGAKGGLGALGLVKEARASLEAALDIDPEALDGSAYTSLGSLYYQVPGWPLGFGDDSKARSYLQKALAINPDGIDANYFFGDFLLDQDEPERARVYLEKVLSAPGRPGRELADDGRRREATQLLGQR
ncbi:tetratricopeptide repeat protein [Marinobacter sp. UBA3607]|uniref:tetratricopeptide repeat protein n=1 Tax=Marinobacter sp. UBA3607 TaxID=1946820 RepID=UPI00257E9F61|nr:tetratricopeptide repeat protein [Marinobacter sp. UBA3607]